MADVLGAIMVPCSMDSMPAVEALFEGATSAFANYPHALTALSVAGIEGGQFVLSQPPAQGASTVLSCSIMKIGNSPTVEFGYPGDGLVINGTRPPYPQYVTGLTFLIARAIGLKLYARVESRDSALIFLREPGLQVSPPTPGGPLSEQDRDFRRMLALLTLCRYWKDVRCIKHSGDVSILRLENPLEAVVSE